MARDGMTTLSDVARKVRVAARRMRKVWPEGQHRIMHLMKELGPEATLYEFKENRPYSKTAEAA